MKNLSWYIVYSLLCTIAFGDTPPTVLKVNGQIGNVVLNTTDITEGTNLYFTNARVFSALGTTYLKADGSIPLTSNWSLGNFKLTNLLDPTNPQDAATKNYVDNHTGATTWGSITGTLSNQLDLQAALDGKEPTITAGSTSQYWRGDKSFQLLNTAAVAELTNLYFTNARARLAISATSPISYDNSTGIISFSGSSGVSGVTASPPLFSSGGATPNITCQTASGSLNGCLLSTDWSTFNSKEPAITGGTTLQYWRGDKSFQTLNTLAVPELTNLYYTQARFDSAFAAKSTTNLAEGSNLYFTNARAQSAISATSPLTYSVGVVGCPTATGSVSGCLSSSDWTTFNNKLSKITGNYITNPDAEIDVSGWNLYNDAGRTVPASVVNQDITFTSALSGGGGNGNTISYTFCGSSYVGPIVTCPSGTAVQVCWYNGPTLADNPTATVLKAAYDAQSCATAIATSAITGTASKLQYESGTSTLNGGGDTSPVDGTGGSVTGVTFTRNTSTPLVGVASFDLGKDANSRLGSGVSTDFVINSIDKNSELQISFIYEASSGMVLGSSSDAQVFVYDIGNSVLIPVTPTATLAGPVSTPKQFVGVFNSSNSSNYRLIIHIATASTTAWDLLLDSVIVNDEVTPGVAAQVPSVVLLEQPISNAVTDHMVVMWTDGAQKWVPATISGAALPTFGDDKTQLGFATNITGSLASIYIKGYMGGFSFGPFVGFEQYIDNIAGGISPLPAPFTDLYVMVGMAISSTELNVQFDTHVDQIQNGSGVPIKGGLLTSSAVNDGTGDVVLSPGANGTFVMANSAAADGLSFTAPVATAPLVYTSSTHTFSCTTATGSVEGCLLAADWTTFNNKASLASPTFTGTPSLPTGTTGVTQTAGNSTTALATTAFATTADNLKANLASPTFTGTPSLPTGTTGVTQTAGNSTTALATTAFATTADNLKANIASPSFTGTVTLPASNLIDGASAATNASIVYKDSHIKSTMTTAPTSVVAAGAGTGGTCTIAHASDTAGIITIVTGSVGTPTTGTQCNLTFNKAYSTIPVCVFTPANTSAGLNSVQFFAGTSTTALQPLSFGVAGGTTTTYIYNYHCLETQ